MNIITPEVIFDRFASRLRERKKDALCIIYAESGYEKWAQWELYLSLEDYYFPVIYNQEMGTIRAEANGMKGDPIADIKLEPRISDYRADLFVATKPFIYRFVKFDTWECKKKFLPDGERWNELLKSYKSTPVHLIELKVEWWLKDVPAGFEKDLLKISYENEKKENRFRDYGAGTLFAISLVTFYLPYKSEKEEDHYFKTLEKYIKDKSENMKFTWLYTHLFDNSFLIGAYRELML